MAGPSREMAGLGSQAPPTTAKVGDFRFALVGRLYEYTSSLHGFRRRFPAGFLNSGRMTSMLVMLFSNPGGSGINSGAASLQAGQGSPAPS